MNQSCGNCKFCKVDENYAYPFRCEKDPKGERKSMLTLNARINHGFACNKYELLGPKGEKE